VTDYGSFQSGAKHGLYRNEQPPPTKQGAVPKGNIKAFESTAKKYHIDFALKKDATETPPRYLVFFKGRDADALTAAFKEFSARKLNREQKPSIRKALSAFREAAQQQGAKREQVKHKERGLDR